MKFLIHKFIDDFLKIYKQARRVNDLAKHSSINSGFSAYYFFQLPQSFQRSFCVFF